MNRSTLTEANALELVDIVHLKWMLAGEGVHVHVERLQTDPEYAKTCLEAAERSPNATVRQAASALLSRLVQTAER
jgi:cell division protein FtsL